jgi:hypothetical protein
MTRNRGQKRPAPNHDRWFREQIEAAIREADNPATEWIPHAVIKQDIARQRAEQLARIERERDRT